MVSRETYLKTPLKRDFVAGIVSVAGTFFHTHTAKVEQFGFQIKLPSSNFALLEQIRQTIGIKTSVGIYTTKGTPYALLITRSKKELQTKVIPFLDSQLLGIKLVQFERWKNMIN